jgi:bifunctional non-homologous end joining protein LigD
MLSNGSVLIILCSGEKKMLKTYKEKRNFSKTPEPTGEKLKKNKLPIFAIQEHHASHLHYDFRLEMEGVLKSWALPKGIPAESNKKHLAVLTEDHPIEYANFSGTIPKGEYGGGEVSIWDKGTFDNLSHNKAGEIKDILKAFKAGHIVFCLHGKKLKGQPFVLHRFKTANKNEWFIFKLKDGIIKST